MCFCFTARTAKTYCQLGIFLNIADSIKSLSFALSFMRLQITDTVLHSLFQLSFSLKQMKLQYQRKQQRKNGSSTAKVLFPLLPTTERSLQFWIRNISNFRQGESSKILVLTCSEYLNFILIFLGRLQ